ncbi:MAG TPA: acetyl-CoA carboxylase biotin carboxyl carrier protein [Rhizomicrobium sp.]|jgi:acetyl-CoA carboxylase biotin carboxyl carrier protein
MKDIKQFGARLANSGGTKAIQVDAAAIRELAELLDQTGLGEIEIEQAGRRIRVARHSPPATAHVAHAPSVLPDAPIPPQRVDTRPASREGAIASPMVGTVYVSPEPGKPPFVKVGDAVREGDTLLIVEAMKTMNPIVATRAGVVQEICVHDAQPVEFGQALMVVSVSAR